MAQNRTPEEPVTVAIVLRPRFGSDGMLRDYATLLARSFVKDDAFRQRNADKTRRELGRIAEDGAQAVLLAEIQSCGIDYRYDGGHECGMLYVIDPRRAENARTRLPWLSARFREICGTPLRYECP